MWNGEDNNPYASGFEDQSTSNYNASYLSSEEEDVLQSSIHHNLSDDDHGPPSFSAHPATFEPLSESHIANLLPQQSPPTSAKDSPAPFGIVQAMNEAHQEALRRTPLTKSNYDSRVEKLLFEHPEEPIVIVDAGKNPETGARHIVYTIRVGDVEVRRRYSEFASLREALTRLHPTLIIPPIPEKHSVANYATHPTSAKQDLQIIELRKRMLAVFLNRCRRMDDVLTDGIWWRFLDPNISWNEVLHSSILVNIPKTVLKAPPIDPANPSPAHEWLPVPPNSAKLKPSASSNLLAGHDNSSEGGTTKLLASISTNAHKMTEDELDPYFETFEESVKRLEQFLSGPIEKLNRRSLNHLKNLGHELGELAIQFNAFSLTQDYYSKSLQAAIELVGVALDTSEEGTDELEKSLGANFAEPMRENAQFAGVVRSVLRYRTLRRAQQELTEEELFKKRKLLSELEQSEAESKRIDDYLVASQQLPARPKSRSDDSASVDSDFPSGRKDDVASAPSHAQGSSSNSAATSSTAFSPLSQMHKRLPSGSSLTDRLFGPIRNAIQGVADVDPEKSRRDLIGRTRESIKQLEEARVVVEKDVKDASNSILRDILRFQAEKENDLRRYMFAYAQSQIAWARKNREAWEVAHDAVANLKE